MQRTFYREHSQDVSSDGESRLPTCLAGLPARCRADAIRPQSRVERAEEAEGNRGGWAKGEKARQSQSRAATALLTPIRFERALGDWLEW